MAVAMASSNSLIAGIHFSIPEQIGVNAQADAIFDARIVFGVSVVVKGPEKGMFFFFKGSHLHQRFKQNRFNFLIVLRQLAHPITQFSDLVFWRIVGLPDRELDRPAAQLARWSLTHLESRFYLKASVQTEQLRPKLKRGRCNRRLPACLARHPGRAAGVLRRS